jgi:hypothetical protein
MKKIKSIQKRNKQFTRATPAQKRVMIAKEAISLIEAKKLIPQGGHYVTFDGKDTSGDYGWIGWIERFSRNDLKTGFKNETLSCQVCQIGQAIVAGTILFNKIKVPTIRGANPEIAAGFVQRWFTPKTIILMECAFEDSLGSQQMEEQYQEDGYGDKITSYAEQERAHNFGQRYDYEDDRSIAIWKNVIENNGEFVPPVEE